MAASEHSPRRSLLGRLPWITDPMFRSAYSLILSTATSSLVGVVYWIVAARAYSPRQLGEGSATISAILLLSGFAQLNLFYALARFLPQAGRSATRLLLRSYAANCVAAVVLGTAFVTIAPRLTHNLSYLERGPAYGTLFVAAVAGWGVFALQDAVLPALRRSAVVPVENALYGVAKLALLVLFAVVWARDGIAASWYLPVLLAIVPINVLVFGRYLPAMAVTGTGVEIRFRDVRRFVAVDYLGSLFLQTYSNALPLLVVGVLGADANATFYVAEVIVGVLDLVSVNLATSLLVEGAAEEGRLAEYTDRMLRRGGAAMAAAVAVLVLVAPYVLAIYGGRYAEQSTTTLRLLALSALPRLLHIIYTSAMRVQRRVGQVVRIEALTSGLVLGLSLVLMPSLGVPGVALAWLGAHIVVAATLLPWLRAVLGWRRSGASD